MRDLRPFEEGSCCSSGPATNRRLLLHRLFCVRMEYGSVPAALAAFVPQLALRNL